MDNNSENKNFGLHNSKTNIVDKCESSNFFNLRDRHKSSDYSYTISKSHTGFFRSNI